MSAKTPLKKLPLFWCALGIPLALSNLCAGIIVYSESSLFFCGTAACFDFAFSMFKVPVAIAALALPCVTLVVANHRSEQSIAQLIKAEAQLEKSELQLQASYAKNSFDNFYKHQEHFYDFLKRLEKNSFYNFNINDETKLYHYIFRKNTPENFSVNENEDNVLDFVKRKVVGLDEELNQEDFNADDMKIYFNVLFGLMDKICIESFKINEKKYYINDLHENIHEYEKYTISIQHSFLNFINKLMSFSSREKKIEGFYFEVKNKYSGYKKYLKRSDRSDIYKNITIPSIKDN